MTEGLPSFDEHSRRVAREFVQTVVFLDDHAFESIEPKAPTVELNLPEVPIDEVEPDDGALSGAHGPHVVEPPAAATEESGLDPRSLIEAFATDGLVCAVLQPEPSGESQPVLDAARRADVVVLDWMIHGDPGGKTIVLLREMLKADAARGGRLRLVAVYTVEPDLSGIIEILHSRLSEYPSRIEVGGLALRGDHFRIVALAKSDARIPTESPLSRNIVDIRALPSRLYAEFAELAEGLVPNVALKGLSVLRDNTHVLLARLAAGLDAGFLAHRLLLDSPDDAGDHVVEILGSEFASMLQAYEVRDEVNIERIEGWLKARSPKLTLPWDKSEWSAEQFSAAFSEGIGPWCSRNDKGGTGTINKNFRLLAQMFQPGKAAADADLSNLRYAEATTFAFRYEKAIAGDKEPTATPPRLTLGTVVKGETGATTSYLVCIQPRCDSVRLKDDDPPAFAFLRGTKVSAADRFDFAVHDGSGYVRLQVESKTSNQVLLRFKPTNGVVRARRTEHGNDFEAIEPAGTYRWIGQLKDTHAQRLAQRFASSISRVGLNESEWLRRSANVKE